MVGFFIDDIKLVEDGGDENLIKNGDFEEQHVDGWAYWTPGKNYAISELGEGYVDNGPKDIIIEKTPEEKKALLTEALDTLHAFAVSKRQQPCAERDEPPLRQREVSWPYCLCKRKDARPVFDIGYHRWLPR